MFMLHIKVQVSFLATYQIICQIKLSQRKFMVSCRLCSYLHVPYVELQCCRCHITINIQACDFHMVSLKCNTTVNEFDWNLYSYQLVELLHSFTSTYAYNVAMSTINTINMQLVSLVVSTTDGILPIMLFDHIIADCIAIIMSRC